jgi:hypothetical protein
MLPPDRNEPHRVIPGLVPGIHASLAKKGSKAWMAGTSPAMTTDGSEDVL